MLQLSKRHDLIECPFYKGDNKEKLANLLEIDIDELIKITNIITYKTFSISKKNSEKKRLITAPNEKLKIIQRRVLFLFQKNILPDWLMSGSKGKSYKSNGLAHINSNYCLIMDIENFYDNCKREAVYNFFNTKLFTSPDISELLTNIVTYKGIIPTGAPTSQLIAYYAYEDMFYEINELAKKYDCIFTLYVDDMTFSSNKPLPKNKIISEINNILSNYKHKLKLNKNSCSQIFINMV